MRLRLAILLAFVLGLAVFVAGERRPLLAQEPDAPADLAGATPGSDSGGRVILQGGVGTAFTYQGLLKKDGAPVNGTLQAKFLLFDAPTEGNQVGTTLVRSINVVNGYFTVSDLDFGDVFTGEARWLAVGVCDHSCNVIIFWNWFEPRTPVSAAPYALSLRPGATISGAAYQELKVVSHHPGGGIPAAVTGEIYAADGVGLFGRNYSTSGAGNGVWAISDSPSGTALLAEAMRGGKAIVAGSYGAGATEGIRGFSNGTGANVIGIHGIASSVSTAIGVEGESSGGYGVVGTSTYGQGVVGRSGDQATGLRAIGVQGIANGVTSAAIGVQGEAAYGTGIKGSSTYGHGVAGYSGESAVDMAGVYGEGHRFGVQGKTAWDYGSGVYGESSGAGYGIRGYSQSGTAVYGYSRSGLAADFAGTVRTEIMQLTGGSDLAERFPTSSGVPLEPGTLMVIDEANPGHLKASSSPYDSKVAGIVSGAGGVQAGLTLQQQGVLEGDTVVAIAGRAYVKAEANSAPIKPGDLLTTSALLGHAMKATDRDLRAGAVIGKAMTALESGTGLVLVLVNLQ